MCWHKWTKWEQYQQDMFHLNTKTNVSTRYTARMQKRTCTKCNYQQRQEVGAF